MPGLIDRLILGSYTSNRKALGVDITKAVIGLTRSGGVEQVPQLEIMVRDPDQTLVGASQLVRPAQRKVGTPDALTLLAVDMILDGTWYRLTQISPDGDVTTLTLEHRGVALMRTKTTALSASRASTTRALFIRRMVDEIARNRSAGYRMAFWAPDLRIRQPIAKLDAEEVKSSSRSEKDRQVDRHVKATLPSDTAITVKGQPADSEQKRNIAIALSVADQLNAGPKATLALLCAGIGESEFRAIPNGAGSNYWGVWQGSKDVWKVDDTEGMARSFLKGGKGFQAGGAISLAQRTPGISIGEIATRVEASGEAGEFYGKYRDEAELMATGLSGVDIAGDDPAQTYTASYRFRRDKGESGWDATDRLAEDVGRVRFVTMPRRGVDLFIYSDGQHLHRLPAQARFSPSHPAVVGSLAYDLDYRKTARALTIDVLTDALSAPLMWGFPIYLDNAGAATGKWIVWGVTETDGEPTQQIELRAPTPAKPEPRSDVRSRPSTGTADEADNPSDDSDGGDKIDGSGLVYPLDGTHGTDLGGAAAHGARAFGNWQSDNAVDIGTPMGTRVVAVDDGTITKLGGSWDGTGRSNPNGFNVTLTTKDNAWFYTHLRYRTDLRVGQKVKAGKFFGQSGAANGVEHLHIGCLHGDPEALLKVKG